MFARDAVARRRRVLEDEKDEAQDEEEEDSRDAHRPDLNVLAGFTVRTTIGTPV